MVIKKYLLGDREAEAGVFVDDLVDEVGHLMNNYSEEGQENFGTGVDVETEELTGIIKEDVGFEGKMSII
jgi:nucleoside-diphosphate-sugar epimerase